MRAFSVWHIILLFILPYLIVIFGPVILFGLG